MRSIISLNPETYQRHRIHTQERDWAETNCYVDIWIELLHALGHEPIAAMPYTLAIDFEGDQWTFFKFPLGDIFDLYGIDVQELAVWKPLISHIEEQVAEGRPVLVELDSYFLPDTAGTAYKLAHVKSTVAVMEIDVENKHLGYFHGQGYYYLEGEDFIKALRLEEELNSAMLPPYVEIAKLRRTERIAGNETLQISLKLLKRQLTHIPVINPFIKFIPRFTQDLEWLKNESLDTFHQYSFATLRQLGACYELASNYLRWLIEQGETGLDDAAKNIKSISETSKVYQFQLARTISRKKSLDTAPLESMKESWDTAMEILTDKYI